MNYSYSVFRPGGNDTALVNGIISDPNKRKSINDAIMASCPTVEQVGFVDLDPKLPELMMAGGEFCGNATRSTAWSALAGQTGEVLIKVSGVENRLRAGVDELGNAWAQMPVKKSYRAITEVNDQTSIVAMEGITQVVTHESLPLGATEQEIKQIAFQILQNLDLTKTVPAAGVMFVAQRDGKVLLTPVVLVRDINTLFYETACGSGSTAIALQIAKQRQENTDIEIIQPTGLPISVQVLTSETGFEYAQISGPIKKIK